MASASAEVPLPRSFYDRDAADVARDLLGATLVSSVAGMRRTAEIVETEAYTGPDDEASHAHQRIGLTRRNALMFGAAGHAYVYRIYGLHWCLNAVTGAPGFPAAVLIRAARPRAGLEAIRLQRPGRADRELLRGPANLARGLGIDGLLNGHPLDEPPLLILPGPPIPPERLRTGPRVGVSRAAKAPLRFWVDGSVWVSAMRGPR